ncbi:Uma2 family endonuclease [Desulfotomaculum copahuensis]|uniref:Putative restriction endonuclease domain-containing protein n=1 Tax=Desulfotomaculum copahuensis TaxID=1838280 RepID=A0A1B7LIP5_9FIRM|nr:Uma2 family endonuclease [Desulfotomaculum copahuensis]OAT86437.1 hypothetical protein A6M21_03155 [Desulfotomaculum copahuensis]
MDEAVQSLGGGFTYEDYCRLQDSRRYELIGGELYLVPSPSVPHQHVSLRLSWRLAEHVEKHDLGIVLSAPIDVFLTLHDVVQPDILFISRERSDIITEANIQGAPDMMVEILSPATSLRDRTVKKDLYARHGVKEMWIIHPLAQTLEIYRAEPAGLTKAAFYSRRTGQPVSSPLLPGLALDLNDIF